MTLRPSDEQDGRLDRQAELEGRPKSAIVLSAIDEYLDRREHKANVRRVLKDVVAEETEVLRRLGQV
ncbi:MAG: hypothetical protein QOE32_5723 [Pseudonocardiales bacterium]|jgi:predicted transcriptional regulator|nr:hypothetical protein [Pseudonocardiales bacterium]MDT7569363.1 hypothetical protein [Pseudonocardiales bacterium]MDT7588173.1 hypothetical protein [Pseudonocardiales bacterium]MDT7665329.1 hypothetical protein [Pseudonocardiales bacterium]MDT7682605.1 hypothetical protein [Pseudonocardiales bacterium]